VVEKAGEEKNFLSSSEHHPSVREEEAGWLVGWLADGLIPVPRKMCANAKAKANCADCARNIVMPMPMPMPAGEEECCPRGQQHTIVCGLGYKEMEVDEKEEDFWEVV
jgi:hypothetical protein